MHVGRSSERHGLNRALGKMNRACLSVSVLSTWHVRVVNVCPTSNHYKTLRLVMPSEMVCDLAELGS